MLSGRAGSQLLSARPKEMEVDNERRRLLIETQAQNEHEAEASLSSLTASTMSEGTMEEAKDAPLASEGCRTDEAKSKDRPSLKRCSERADGVARVLAARQYQSALRAHESSSSPRGHDVGGRALQDRFTMLAMPSRHNCAAGGGWRTSGRSLQTTGLTTTRSDIEHHLGSLAVERNQRPVLLEPFSTPQAKPMPKTPSLLFQTSNHLPYSAV